MEFEIYLIESFLNHHHYYCNLTIIIIIVLILIITLDTFLHTAAYHD